MSKELAEKLDRLVSAIDRHTLAINALLASRQQVGGIPPFPFDTRVNCDQAPRPAPSSAYETYVISSDGRVVKQGCV